MRSTTLAASVVFLASLCTGRVLSAAPLLLVGNQNAVSIKSVVASAPLTPSTLTGTPNRYLFGLAVGPDGRTWFSAVTDGIGAQVGTLNPATGQTISYVVTNDLFTGISWKGNTLYGVADRYDLNSGNNSIDMLGTIDTTTGGFSEIGASQFIDDIAFVGNTLYGLSRNQGLVTFNLSNGAVTDVFAGDELNDDRGMAYVDGTMYLTKTGLQTINLTTGALATIGTNAEFGNLQGAVSRGAPVPEPTTLAAVASLGAHVARRRGR